MDAKNLQAQVLIANATAGLKDLGGAIRRVKTAVAVDPRDPAAQYLLARTRRCCSWPREPTARPIQAVTAADRSSSWDPRW